MVLLEEKSNVCLNCGKELIGRQWKWCNVNCRVKFRYKNDSKHRDYQYDAHMTRNMMERIDERIKRQYTKKLYHQKKIDKIDKMIVRLKKIKQQKKKVYLKGGK